MCSFIVLSSRRQVPRFASMQSHTAKTIISNRQLHLKECNRREDLRRGFQREIADPVVRQLLEGTRFRHRQNRCDLPQTPKENQGQSLSTPERILHNGSTISCRFSFVLDFCGSFCAFVFEPWGFDIKAAECCCH